ncbi:MAG: nitroreductase [Armatimonadetes bacterium]|nr:nitroreductase [Armatimonadota bacterium]
MSMLDVIKARRSVPKVRADPVPREVIEQMLDVAVWAPNHRLTEPWRFYVLIGDGKRRFAEIRRRFRASTFPNPEAPEAQKALGRIYQDTMATPAIIAVTAHQAQDDETRHEDTAATFMALQNLMLAGAELGVGTYMRTGPLIDNPEVRTLLGVEDDRRILAMVYVGYPAETPQKRRTPAAEKTVWL